MLNMPSGRHKATVAPRLQAVLTVLTLLTAPAVSIARLAC
jgi:hypothetical protein